MAKAYSIDLRRRALSYVKEGHDIIEASELFNVDRTTLWRWHKRVVAGQLEAYDNKTRRAKKLDGEKMKEYIARCPDATLKEIGEHFGAAASSVYARIKSLGFTYKKKSFYTKSATKKNVKRSLKS